MSVTGVRRLEPLTGLRIFAALVVFLSHIPKPPGAPAFLQAFMDAGYSGVTLFFILSGFIIAWNYEPVLGERLTGSALRTFYVARLARIYPLYLGALLLVILPTIDTVGDVGEDLSSGVFWTHLFALQGWGSENVFAFNRPAWSISVEFFLYAAFPLVLIATRRIRQSQTGLVTLAAAAVAVSFILALVFALTGLGDLPRGDPNSAHRWLYWTPLTRLPDFVLGVAMAGFLHRRQHLDDSRWGRWTLYGGVVIAAVIMAVPALTFTAVSWDAIYMIPFAAIILGLAVAPRTVLARALGSRPFAFLGEASYAFYLLHVFVILSLAHLIGTGVVSWATGVLTILAVSLLAAAGAHVVIERPFRAFVRRILDPRKPTNLSLELPIDELEVSAEGNPATRSPEGFAKAPSS